jgi:diguanylate cyclase (GGDEF)-like protein
MSTPQVEDIDAPSTRILIVEDEPSLRAILKLQLEKEGYEVLTAADGVDGLSAVVTANIPVIMLTARFELKDRLKCLSDGANDYMTKPYEVDELLIRVRNLLMWSRTQRDANPLTGLPGNVAIEKEFQHRVANKETFAFLYLDIDHFKAFNDYYGYRKGDEALGHLADLLVAAVRDNGSPGDFVGHVGGDDFVVIGTPKTAQEVVRGLLDEFDRTVPDLYDAHAREQGFIEVSDRRGRLKRFPIMTLTVAGVTNEGRQLRHVGEICDIAAELKHVGKQYERSVLVWERRSGS